MRQPLVIANGLLPARVRQQVHARLTHCLGPGVDWYLTTARGDATRRARQALRCGADWLIIGGGDGTINEVVNGYFEDGNNIRPECPLSFLPLGSGNDWLRTLGIPLDVKRAVDLLPDAPCRFVDVGLARFVNARGACEQRAFMNFAEAGVGARLVHHLNRSAARRNRAAYILSAIVTAMRYEAPPVQLRTEGSVSGFAGALLSFIVANGRFFGAGMECAPMARPDDGRMDVITIGDFGRLELILKIRKLIHGKHLSEAKVSHFSAASLEASSSTQPMPLQLDGENVGTLPASFTILPRSLQLRYRTSQD